jgi:hypothetical protein
MGALGVVNSDPVVKGLVETTLAASPRTKYEPRFFFRTGRDP